MRVYSLLCICYVMFINVFICAYRFVSRFWALGAVRHGYPTRLLCYKYVHACVLIPTYIYIHIILLLYSYTIISYTIYTCYTNICAIPPLFNSISSSFQQVFISIQALVLVADPYFVSYTCYICYISIYLSNAVTYYTFMLS